MHASSEKRRENMREKYRERRTWEICKRVKISWPDVWPTDTRPTDVWSTGPFTDTYLATSTFGRQDIQPTLYRTFGQQATYSTLGRQDNSPTRFFISSYINHVFARYSVFYIRIQRRVELHLQPNVSTLQSIASSSGVICEEYPSCWQMTSSHDPYIRSQVATSDHVPLMKTLDWGVKTLGCKCNSTGLWFHL
jgi:hypothetical protein